MPNSNTNTNSNNQNQTLIEDVKIDMIRKGTKKYKIKSYVIFGIIIALILLLLIFIGSIGNDIFGLLVFITIMIIPAIILFRNKLGDVLPPFISKSLFEIDHELDSGTKPLKVSKYSSDMGQTIVAGVLIIGAIVLMSNYRKKLEDKMTFFKIFGSILLLAIAGIIVSDLTGESIDIVEGDEEMSDAAQQKRLSARKEFKEGTAAEVGQAMDENIAQPIDTEVRSWGNNNS